MGKLERGKNRREKTANKPVLKRKLLQQMCLRRQALRRSIFKSEILSSISRNLPPNLRNSSGAVVNLLIVRNLTTSEKIKGLINTTQRNSAKKPSLSLKRLLVSLGVKEKNWETSRDALFMKFGLRAQGKSYKLSRYFLPDKSNVVVAPNASESTKKNHAVLRALFTLLEVVSRRIEGRELKLKTLNSKDTLLVDGKTPEFINVAQKVREHLKSKSTFKKTEIQKLAKKNGISLYRLMYTIGLTSSVMDGGNNKKWLQSYYNLGLSPLPVSQTYKPNHPLITKTFKGSRNLEIRQKRSLLNELLQILLYLENCSTTKKTTKVATKGGRTPETQTRGQSVEQKILQKFPKLATRMRTFKRNFNSAKAYLTSAKFLNNLKKSVGDAKYNKMVETYKLSSAGINFEDYLALVFKESTLRASATTRTGRTAGYFQLYGGAALRDVNKVFKFSRIKGSHINMYDPMHNCVIGILYHKYLLHNRTDFTRYKISMSPADKRKTAMLMYNVGVTKIRRFIINIMKTKTGQEAVTYAEIENKLNGYLCMALGGCAGISSKRAIHKQTKTSYTKLPSLIKFEQLKAKGDSRINGTIRVHLKTKKASTTRFKSGSQISISAKKIREALEYVRVISSLESNRRITSTPTTTKVSKTKPTKKPAKKTPTKVESMPPLREVVVYSRRTTLKIQKLYEKVQPHLFSKLTRLRQIYLWTKESPTKNKKKIALAKKQIQALDKKISTLRKAIAAIRSKLNTDSKYHPFLVRPGTGKGEQLNFEISLAHKFNLPKVWSWQSVDKLKKSGQLVPILTKKTVNGKTQWISKNGFYKASPSSFASDYKPYLRSKWKMTAKQANEKGIQYFANLRPSTKKFLDQFSKYYATTAHKKVCKLLKNRGCPSKPKPLLLGSVTRTRLYQHFVKKKRTIASRLTSAHEFGHTFDISERSFEGRGNQLYYTYMRREMIRWVKAQEKKGYDAYRKNPLLAAKNKVMLVQYTAEARGRRFHITAFHPNDVVKKSTRS